MHLNLSSLEGLNFSWLGNIYASLFQLINTKDKDNKNSLLYFLVEYVDKFFPDIVSFTEEIAEVEFASKVDFNTLKGNLIQMNAEKTELESELKIAYLGRDELDADDR